MIKNTFLALTLGFKYLFRSKINIFLSMAPVLIGLVLYYFLGVFMYENMLGMGKEYINEYFETGITSSIVYYLVAIVLTVILYFLINWTFVLIVSTIASPFNDQLSKRIEKQFTGIELDSFSTTVGSMFSSLFSTLFNEIKKVLLIFIFTILAFVFSYIPFLTPFSLLITAWLLAAQFVDYTWSRHDLPSKECMRDVKQNMVPYGLSGAFFFFIVSIPGLNIIVPSLATSYYTIYWVRKHNENSRQIT